jgi:hypothetical protein
VILVAQRQVQDDVGGPRKAEPRKLIGESATLGLGRVGGGFGRGYGRATVPSTSISAPRGNAATWYVARAG